MRRSVLAPVIAFALIALPFSAARAADAAGKPEAGARATPEAAPANDDASQLAKAMEGNPYKDEMVEKATKLSASLSETEIKNLAGLLPPFNALHAVRNAHDKVDHAVQQCAAANADISEKITERYKDWDGRLTPVMAEQKKNMDDAVAQKFSKPEDVKDYLGVLEKALRHNEEEDAKRHEVSTKPDDCKFLMESMDKTGPSLVAMLNELKWDAPAAAAPVKEEAPAAGKPAEERKAP
jgi:hypothetical protein